MNADRWLHAFAEEIGVAPPDDETSGLLLDLAATAAHNSERIAAPLACYMTGLSGKSPQEAREAAERVEDD